MKSIVSPYIYLSALFLFGPLLASGTGAAETGESISVEFSCLHWDGDPDRQLYYREGEEFHLLKFRRGARSKTASITGMAEFELYGTAVDPKEGESPYILLAKTAIPSGVNQALFYIIEDKDAEEPRLHVIAMDDSLEAFPRGNFRFVNLSGQNLSIEFAGQTKEIPVNGMSCIHIKLADKAGSFIPCIIRAVIEGVEQEDDGQAAEESYQQPQIQDEAKDKILFGTRLFGQPSARELVLIRPSSVESSDRLRLKFYSQLIAIPLPPNG